MRQLCKTNAKMKPFLLTLSFALLFTLVLAQHYYYTDDDSDDESSESVDGSLNDDNAEEARHIAFK